MMNTADDNAFRHRGYASVPEIDVDSQLIHGRVMGLRDVIHYEGRTVEEAYAHFVELVDFYIASCEADGAEPETPFSGKLALRTTPETHRLIERAAASVGMSTNEWMGSRLAADAAREADEALA